MAGGDIDDLREDLARTFTGLKHEFGIIGDVDDEPKTELDYDAAEAAVAPAVPPSPAKDDPAPLAVPDPPTIEAEPEDDLRYPGSRHLRRGATEEPEPEPEEIDWDRNPREFLVDGKKVELFTISALAEALRRQAVTIRKWEAKGYVPRSRYRSPGATKRDRLYTRQQIEGLVALAQDEGLMHPEKKTRIDQTKFPERAHRLFAALAQKR